MAMPDYLKKSLEQSGVKFDEHGNVIGDDLFDSDDQEDQDEDQELDEDVEDDSDEDVEPESDEDEDETEDEDEEEEEEPSEDTAAPKKKPVAEEKKFKLTPRAAADQGQTSSNSEIESLKNEIRQLKEALQSGVTQGRAQVDESADDEDSTQAVLEKLKSEREQFQQFRMKQLATTLSNEVDRRFKDANITFADITSSQEWDNYLKTKRYGSTIGKFYVDAVKSADLDQMLNFFDEFKTRIEPTIVSNKTPKKSLSDLAVPDKNKATRRVKKPTKYLYDESDYSTQLRKFERGEIDAKKFADFEKKFDAADRQGRVRPSP